MHCFRCNSDSAGESDVCEVCGKPLDADSDRYFRAGMNALLSGELDVSARLLQDCVQLNPTHISGRYNLGLALCMLDRREEAVQQYMGVIEIEPDYPGIYTALGQAAFGEYLQYAEQADNQCRFMFQMFAKAIEQDPDDIDAYYSLANAYMAIGSAREALPWLRRAKELQPESSAIFYALGKAYSMLNRHDEAAEMAKVAMQLSGMDDPLRDEIGVLLAECEQR